MVMIVNLNIAVDKTVNVGSFKKGGIYRYGNALTLPGGKGINVARALRSLGITPEIRGFISGHNGDWIEENLRREGFRTVLFRHWNGESRVCYSIVETGGISTDFNEDGPSVPAACQEKFLKSFEKDVRKFRIICISGRTCQGLKKGFYVRLVKSAKKHGATVFVDTTRGALKEAVLAGADVVKINNYEFEEFFGRRFSEKNVGEFYSRFSPGGLKTIVVTNRSKPFYCCHEGVTFRIIPPAIRNIKSPVGAGDSFLAGFIFSFYRGEGIIKMLAISTAAAYSDCVSLGAGLISRKEVLNCEKKIKITRIKR